MQFQLDENVLKAGPGIARIRAVAYSPDGRRLAVAVPQSQHVHLYDQAFKLRDRFPLKPRESGNTTFVVRSMAWSPDRQILAVGQSDRAVFAYSLGTDWGDRKAIVSKATAASEVSAVCWPSRRPDDLVYGCGDGKVKNLELRTSKSGTLVSSSSSVVSLATSMDGLGVLSGHLDGTIWMFAFDEAGVGVVNRKFSVHSCPPYVLAWGEAVAACGSDCRVVFYDRAGSPTQRCEYRSEEEKEFCSGTFNPGGHCFVVGSWDRFRSFNYNTRRERFEEGEKKEFEGLATVTNLVWKPDGTTLVMASLRGALDTFSTCIKRYRQRQGNTIFDFTYVSLGQVIVRRDTPNAAENTSVVLKSTHNLEINKVDVHKRRFLVAYTEATLLLGDMDTCRLSEIPWSGGGNERFFFDNPDVCMVFNAGELNLVEYGRNEVIVQCRTEFVSGRLLSVRISGATPDATGVPVERRKKCMAFLVDQQSIRILDLVSGIPVATIRHDVHIDWLSLSQRSTKLLFRDKHKQLFLFDVASQTKTTLLTFCTFAEWVPRADVIVAQSGEDMCVWYAVDCPDHVTVTPIKGDIQEAGRTEVLVVERTASYAYPLLEPLVEFGSALDAGDLGRAFGLLEETPTHEGEHVRTTVEGMWQALSGAAMRAQQLYIAERCAAALGDTARSRSLRHTIRTAEQLTAEHADTQGYDPLEDYQVQVSIALLNNDFDRAEKLLLDRNRVDEALRVMEELHLDDRCIKVAVSTSHPKADLIRQRYLEFLIQHRQEEKAGEMMEEDHRFSEAVEMYLKAGLPARAARVVQDHNVEVNDFTLEAIASGLHRGGMFERSGQFFEKLGMFDRAIAAYKLGRAYARAVEMSRTQFPGQVSALEETWGDWLVQQKQSEQAINHFIEAGNYVKAVETAMTSRQWQKAAQMLSGMDQDSDVTRKQYQALALHYEEAHQYVEAEKYFLKAEMLDSAVEMYVSIGKWDDAHRLATMYDDVAGLQRLCRRHAGAFEAMGKYRDAERMYLRMGDPNSAIKMEHLEKGHLAVGHQLRKEGNYRRAEHHYAQAGEWRAAVRMYIELELWDDAIRVAKVNSVPDFIQVVFRRASQLGGDAGTAMLAKHGLIGQAIENAVDRRDFATAVELATSSMPTKLSSVLQKQGEFLEEQERYEEAEETFVKAGVPKEAVEMYLDRNDWEQAMRVAEQYVSSSISDVREHKAKYLFDGGNVKEARELMIQAQRPEKLCWWFQASDRWLDALELAREYCPGISARLDADYGEYLLNNPHKADPVETGKRLEQAGDFPRAIKAYLLLGPEHRLSEDEMVRIWLCAVNIARNQSPEALKPTMEVVSKKLSDTGRYAAAGEMYEQCNDYTNAISVYIKGDLWPKALSLANHVEDRAASQRMRNQYKEHLIRTQDFRTLLDMGWVEEALMVLCDLNKLGEMISQARRHGMQNTEIIARFSPKYIEKRLDEGTTEMVVEAMTAAIIDGMSTDQFHYATYERLARAVIGVIPRPDWDHMPFKRALNDLVTYIRSEGLTELAGELVTLSVIHHQYATASVCAEHPEFGPPSLSVLLLSLARYADIIPGDKALYEAGMAAKRQGWLGTAFVLLDRFVEIYDYIDDVASDPMTGFPDEKAEFQYSDVPSEVLIPPDHVVRAEQAEEARRWVLTESIARNFEFQARTRQCPHCDTDIHEASLECLNCHVQWDACVVSGFPCPPVGDRERVGCRSCGAPAVKDHWNRYVAVARVCPWCLTSQAGFYDR